ncbi:outer membrane autotransporter protein [Litoreibacter ponti]|uniref:Outer membrane autotransporter protein n=1 Tax=Litoreibacter ponti TaxID=1510457 RepID=A0A2T6BJV5_9RHOB|nr:autotransporter outer membrane beta-barrel domain-containing protein [Litoreibacter ponti]PTX56343.1 outer membrane autotransporter protein [Litoreibacter ponti]
MRISALTLSPLLAILPLAAAAQSTNDLLVSPPSEAGESTAPALFQHYRDAIAKRRRALGGAPGVRQDATLGNEAPTWGGLSSAWGSLDGKQINGTYSGDSTSLLFGADAILGSGTVLVGLIGGYNTSTVTLPTGQRVGADGFSIGPYFSAQISERIALDGFIAYGEPDYDVDGGSFSGDKLFGNLTISTSFPLQAAEISPFLSVASSREDLPAFTDGGGTGYAASNIESFVTTIGATAFFNPVDRGGRTYLPTAGLELDYIRSDDGFGTVSSFTAPRVTAGVTILGDTGIWSLGADATHTSEGTTTVGANASYIWQF